MRILETRLNKNKDTEIYTFVVGRDEAYLIQEAVRNVYISIPKNLFPLQPTKARAWNIYKELAKITNKA